jgi:hypothetical protein
VGGVVELFQFLVLRHGFSPWIRAEIDYDYIDILTSRDKVLFENVILSTDVMPQRNLQSAGNAAEIRARDVLDEFVSRWLSENDQLGDERILRAEAKNSVLVVETKSTSRRGIEDLRGCLATAVLQLRKFADASEYPVAIVHAPKIGRRALSRLEEFMDEYAPEIGWGVFDDRGTVRLKLDKLGIDHLEMGSTDTTDARTTTHNKRAFTDLNRWLLKVLLLRDAPLDMWREGEIRAEVANPPALARVAGVSQAKAYQFARTFRDLNWLAWSRGTFEITDRRGLFEQWYEDERQVRVEEIPVRPMFPGTQVEQLVTRETDTLDFAIAGFAACSAHGVLHTAMGVPKIHIFKSAQLILDELDLETCSPRNAELFLIEPPHEESVRRGVLPLDDAPVVDILQAALDVSHEVRRGREQVDYILDHVLGWTR